MILKRLHDLAIREGLLDDLAFESKPVPFVIELGEGGAFRGISQRRGKILVQAKKKGREPKEKPDSGVPISVPRQHGGRASQGSARFFADNIPRIVPMAYDLVEKAEDERSAELAKRGRSRATFWSQIDRAADETDDPALRAVQAFGRRLAGDPGLAADVELRFSKEKAAESDRCTFAYLPHMGRTIVDHDVARSWYRKFFGEYTGGRQEAGPTGLCQVTGRVGPIPTTHPIKLQVPGWMSMGVALVSYDKPAFQSFGLEGTANAAVGYEAADGYGVALQALIANKLPRGGKSAFRVGESLFLFWTREPASMGFADSFEAPSTEAVDRLLASAGSGDPDGSTAEPNDFYCLVLSSNAARVIVRDYLEVPLAKARDNVAAWFGDLKIASTNQADLGRPTAAFPLWMLAASLTVKRENKPDWQRIGDLVPRLMAAALKGGSLPDSILATCLARLRAEGEKGFRPPRMALMKLCLIRKGVPVGETHNPNESNPAYLCGELLAVFDQIQNAALGKINATVIDKHYGRVSASPSTTLGQLFRNAQNHLRKLRGEKPAYAAKLENDLATVSKKLIDVPDGQLTLTDQARFALGYYHAKARRIEDWARRKREKAEAEASKKSGRTTTALPNNQA